jgi:cell division protein FtsL
MKNRPFLVLWTLAVVAATSAFTVYLALRMRSVELGYDLGRAHAHLGRLREVKRVLELELASYETPERVDLVARSVLGMSEPSADRILPAGPRPVVGERAQGIPEEIPVATIKATKDGAKVPAAGAGPTP